ncbi:MAG TPA: hypothetical protein VH559_17195 [Gemmatimonadaceae bacterium]|jgi:hypothetical protein
MRARILFQGLTLFSFDKPTASAKPGDNMGTMTAWLVSDPKHMSMPLHTHKPLMGFIGRDRGKKEGRVETKRWVPKEMRIDLAGHDVPNGVRIDGSFLNYVPRIGALKYSPRRSREEILASLEKLGFVTTRIVIPRGTVAAKDFITWDWCGNTPARISYMDTNFHGFGTTEVVVDIGDDSDFHADDEKKCLLLSGRGPNAVQMHVEPNTVASYEFNAALWPRSKTATDDDIEPNCVEVRITNLPAKRRRPVFWGVHYQSLFDAAGYPRQTAYTNVNQYNSFVSAALEYDSEEWLADSKSMGVGHPFPFLIDPRRNRLPGIANGHSGPLATVPPPPRGRRATDGTLRSDTGETMPGMGHDPDARDMCPHGSI